MFIGTQIKPSHLNLACGTAGERWRDRPPPSFFRGFRTPASEKGRRHFDQAIALYDPAAHRSLAARFGADVKPARIVSGEAVYEPRHFWRLGPVTQVS
jgi:hypothetical protein